MINTLKLLALVLLLNVAGCTTVLTTIVDEPISADPTEPPLGTGLNDLKIATYIGVNINKADPILNEAHINVHAYNGVILLTGEVQSAELRRKAGEVANAFSGVRQVYNELVVAANSSVVSRANDSLIASQVRTKLLFHEQIESSKIDVIVENNTVFLMGLVTRNTADLAATVAANSRGVERVVRAFEIAAE
ncbi:BON domain-containing protein [Gammaproteobacteria bacterium LSUCC0057]|uniref:BON domain-containing protein n=1 Tax=Gammaproteobacteria bacterium LSUCC0057 TaxID=2559237 RepID=A0A4Y8UIX6_9GAMM|nr:BON domain-containing protein [Gammaproteobacteria bacterium LSUCC0057]